MPLSSVAVTGFKAFREKATLDIRPLTLVYGYNSAGKSSLIRTLPLLRDSVSGTVGPPLAVGAQAIRGASLVDLFSKKLSTQQMVFELKFTGQGPLKLARYTFRAFGRTLAQRVVIEKLELEGPRSQKHTVALSLGSVERGSYEQDEYVLDQQKSTKKNAFLGLMPTPSVAGPGMSADLVAQLREELLATKEYLWIGPLRAIPGRIERDVAAATIDSTGHGASDVLSENEKLRGDVVGRVRNWFEAHTEYSLRIVRGAHEFGGIHSLAFSPKNDLKTSVPLEDTGEGIAQVLPILTAAAIATNPRSGSSPVVVVEHPDLHLHSTIHSALLEFFLDSLKAKSRPRFVLETHSEAMLMGIQAAIVDGKIAPSDVILHWIRSSAEGDASVTSITFDDMGYAAGAVSPVFDWYADLHKEMQRLSSKRLAKK